MADTENENCVTIDRVYIPKRQFKDSEKNARVRNTKLSITCPLISFSQPLSETRNSNPMRRIREVVALRTSHGLLPGNGKNLVLTVIF